MTIIIPANTLADAAFSVDNSCRFNDGDSPRLHKTLGTPTNVDKWTFSAWIKRGVLGINCCIFEGFNDDNNKTRIRIINNDKLFFGNRIAGSFEGLVTTNRVLRDPSAWYHIVGIWDSDNASAGSRMRLFVNGVEETSFTDETQLNLAEVAKVGSGHVFNVGCSGTPDEFFDGYLAEVCFIDGQALTPTSFGEFDEDSPTIWKPIDVSGLTFGNNGFYLDFEDSSNLGNDANGGTDFTEVNLAAVDQATDTPTNNFCIFNVLNPTFEGTNSEGNCKHLSSGSNWRAIYGTIPFTTGKWYAEFKMVADGSSAGPGVINIDAAIDNFLLTATHRGLGQQESGVAYLSNAQILDGGNTIKTGQTTWTDNDILGVAIDATNGFVYWHKNGTYMDGATSGTTVGVPTSGGSGTGGYPLADLVAANGTYLFGVGGDDAWHVEANFGGCSAFTVSSANADADGYGAFEYAVPSGYFALCTKNLAEYG